MKIESAIEELERGARQNRSTNNQRLREALKLGLEALRDKEEQRRYNLPSSARLLPGETKD